MVQTVCGTARAPPRSIHLVILVKYSTLDLSRISYSVHEVSMIETKERIVLFESNITCRAQK